MDGRSSSQLRRLIRASWERSLAAGVAPDQNGAPLRLVGSELEEARALSPFAPAAGLIQSVLATLDSRPARRPQCANFIPEP
ncbi:MAG: hypothetical protein ACLP01_10340 [Solirubrobacteraceae bacterium]